MHRTIICLLSLTVLAFSCGSKDDDESGDSSWYDDDCTDTGTCPGADTGSYPSDDAYFCMVIAETCEAFADHYLTCEGADEYYAASLADYDDAACAATYATWVAAGCCGDS